VACSLNSHITVNYIIVYATSKSPIYQDRLSMTLRPRGAVVRMRWIRPNSLFMESGHICRCPGLVDRLWRHSAAGVQPSWNGYQWYKLSSLWWYCRSAHGSVPVLSALFVQCTVCDMCYIVCNKLDCYFCNRFVFWFDIACLWYYWWWYQICQDMGSIYMNKIIFSLLFSWMQCQNAKSRKLHL
jgi:hypothetical protein